MVLNMGIPVTERFITIEEYLDGETRSEVRHEYIGGQVYAMSGGSGAHNLICGNLYAAIRQHLRGKPCKVFMADMKLRLNIAAAPDAINITHTFVPDHLRGRGIAAQLMDAAIGYTVKSGLNVYASCDYAEAYLKRKAIQG